MIIFTCHLQRVVDALPSGGQIPKTDNSIIYVVSGNVHTSTLPPPSQGIYDISYAIRAAHHFLSTPFKSNTHEGTDAPEEVLKGGAFYRECAAVNLRIRSPATADATDTQVPDDGELEGVHLGQAVWEGR
ncbi:hypothetical protein DFJ58DRAFT_913133 [Suillus subalutaceus]|uniref:uncharacterized protein n=1 Tax=Suillus subalutaceus TaxID=48586 RepID=UPI001B863429|nr:uncharacterized protein DFJ58DRAFT_913133 [Suillus subalutaceus]KAG1859595.1 hypothetical protein DFJ58DRAFT_913133 [Suillus subalutaceus]